MKAVVLVVVAVLVALTLLQPVRPQSTENHSNNKGEPQPPVLNLDHYLLQLNNKLDNMNNKLQVLETSQQQTARELSNLQTSVSSKLDSTHSKLDSTSSKLDSLTATTTQLSSDLQEISDMECTDQQQNIQLHQNLQDNITHQLETIKDSRERPPGYTCGGIGGWRRVAYLDMTDPSTTCPSGWQLTGYSKRTCGRVNTGRYTCDSATFPVSGVQYSRVCGRIKAYQYGGPDAFLAYYWGRVTTIDGAYVSGVSVTHGTPRYHIWTFANGATEADPIETRVCPCDASIIIRVPPFVGNDYFCESGINEPWLNNNIRRKLYLNDTLWDGEDCLPSSRCCSLYNLPYFFRQLPTSTTDDIEARICLKDPSYDNIAVELVELYVQ